MLRFGRSGLRPHRFEQAILLNRMLAYLTRTGTPFPVPWFMSEESRAALESACPAGRGLLVCSAHLPLIKVGARALQETGHTMSGAIAADPDQDGCIAIWGLRERLPAIKVQANVLLRTRTELRKGGCVVLLVDTVKGEYSPNVFRLAASTGAGILFLTTELSPDGRVEVRIWKPPAPACATPEQITGNLLALDAAVKRISGRGAATRFDTVPLIG
jgi:hypothetical protein